MQLINIRWLGHTGLIVKRCVPKGASIEERFTNLLEVSTARGEYVVTAPYLGRVAWIRRPGVVMRGEVVARMWVELPEQEGPVSDWQPAKVYAQPTQALPVPYALNTPSPTQSVRMGEGAGDWARARAKAMGMGVGPFFDLLVYTFATMPKSEQEEALGRFTKALEA